MAKDIINITNGDSMAMQQYLDAFRRSEYLGAEKSLLVAILDDAVQEYKKYYRADDGEGKRRFREVEEWVMHAGDGWIFSFDNICELLGLDPEYVRRALYETQFEPGQEKTYFGQ
jgi:hypothetical protein